MASLSQHMFGLNDRMDDADDLPRSLKSPPAGLPLQTDRSSWSSLDATVNKNAPSLPTRPYVTVALQSKGKPPVKIASPA